MRCCATASVEGDASKQGNRTIVTKSFKAKDLGNEKQGQVNDIFEHVHRGIGRMDR